MVAQKISNQVVTKEQTSTGAHYSVPSGVDTKQEIEAGKQTDLGVSKPSTPAVVSANPSVLQTNAHASGYNGAGGKVATPLKDKSFFAGSDQSQVKAGGTPTEYGSSQSGDDQQKKGDDQQKKDPVQEQLDKYHLSSWSDPTKVSPSNKVNTYGTGRDANSYLYSTGYSGN